MSVSLRFYSSSLEAVMQDVLLLNADFVPLGIVAWQKAVCLLLARKARAVVSYADRFVRSPGLQLEWPAVVYLVDYVRVRRSPKLTRVNVLARDGFRCQYCGSRPVRLDGRPDVSMLTLDHVVPRAQAEDGIVQPSWGGAKIPVTSWRNLTTACAPCNHRKAANTPEQAGMGLRTRPFRPGPAAAARIAVARTRVPMEWRDYL
ncbi:MAG: 5-methylcytosine-specific restriction endonuclease McrA [Kiritimatiellia bacterium]|jgi:5-methylcytosine-specific restriction endonuclease McrA